jgi:hypothetical protein
VRHDRHQQRTTPGTVLMDNGRLLNYFCQLNNDTFKHAVYY